MIVDTSVDVAEQPIQIREYLEPGNFLGVLKHLRRKSRDYIVQ